MGRMILGVVTGFVVWSLLWVSTHMLLIALSPDWYGRIDDELQAAIGRGDTAFAIAPAVLAFSLVRSVIFSLVSGYLAALIAGENAKAPAVLGILLLVVGILTQAAYWNYMPVWYHLIFLALLLPMTIAGGKLRR